MPADKKMMGNFFGNGEKDKHERVSNLIRAIRTEMKDMTPNELERLYAVIALTEKKKTREKGC